MGVIEVVLIGLGLSFDTFAVSISTGCVENRIRFWRGVWIAIVLAFFQSLMPLLGWLGGSQIVKLMESIDHWIAFVLLAFIGIRMIINAFKGEEESKVKSLSFRVLVLMGIATSIDALVVGLSLAFVEINIYQSIFIIGAITFLAAMTGMLLGKNVKGTFGKRVEVLGGLILFGIGLKILVEHLS